MSGNFNTMALRLQQDVPLAEASLDSALIAVSTLMTSVVTARQSVGVAAKTGQASILRLAGHSTSSGHAVVCHRERRRTDIRSSFQPDARGLVAGKCLNAWRRR